MYRSTSLRLALFCAALIALPLFGIGLISSSAASDDDQVINSLGATDYVRFVSLPTNDVVFNSTDSKLYASVPSSAARGVTLRITGPRKPPIISTKL